AMTQKEAMAGLPWDSVGSTSWLAPGQWGETHIWVGNELKRYPVKYKESSRKRHRTAITDAGFDAVAIARDATDEGTSEDRTELLRLSLWSWSQFVDHINERAESVADEPERTVRGAPREVELVRRDKVLLPVLALSTATVEEGTEEPQVESTATNLMRCNNCY